MSPSDRPPKFTSLELDDSTDKLAQELCEHDWQGYVNVAGELRLRCTECGGYAKCSCCDESIRNRENTQFVCGCSWSAKTLFDDANNCDLHSMAGPGSVSMTLQQGTKAKQGEVCFIDHGSGNIYTGGALEFHQRGPEAPKTSAIGVVQEVRDDGSVVIALSASLPKDLP